MPTVTAIVTDAYMEIGVLTPTQTLDTNLGALGLLRFQQLLDAWQADRLSLAVQSRVTFPLVSGTSSVTIGPSGSVTTTPATTTAPMWLDTVCYINPGSSPSQEVAIGMMDRDTYASLSIKELGSALPLQGFYQRSNTTALGTLFLWPQVTQNITIVLYSPQGVGVPTLLADTVTGPPGYLRAFCKCLALDLCAPTGTAVPEMLPSLAAQAKIDMQRPNIMPGLMGVDPATTNTWATGYNVYSDVTQTSR
jgi:hypothetical protein